MSFRAKLLSAALIVSPAVLTAQTPVPPASTTAAATAAALTIHPRVGNETELGRKYTTWFFTSQFDSLWAHMSQDMKDDLGEPSAMATHRDQLTSRAGDEVEVLDEMVMMRNGAPQYWRTSKYSMMSEPVMLRWAIIDGEIVGIGMNPASQAPETDAEQ